MPPHTSGVARKTLQAPPSRFHLLSIPTVVGAGLTGAGYWVVGLFLAVGGASGWMFLVHRWIRNEKERLVVGPGDNVEVLYPESQRRAATRLLSVFVWTQVVGIVLLVTFVIYALAAR